MALSTINKKFLRLALITSPIIAIYGAAPLYILDKLQVVNAFILGFGLTVNILIVWFANVFIFNKFNHWPRWKMYVASFAFGIVSNLPKIWLKPSIEIVNIVSHYIAYPALTGIGVNIIIWVFINSIDASTKKEKAEALVASLSIKNLESQQQILNQQLQPHFLFNALSTLKSLIHQQPQQAEDYTIKLSAFLRYAVDYQQHNVVPLEDELRFSINYIQLQKLRFGEALQYQVVQTAFGNDTKKIPVFALQTLVENAIKHNQFTVKKPLQVHIAISADEITVSNNVQLKNELHVTGTGLNNLNQRYQLIAQEEIQIQQSFESFSVTLKLL